MCSSLLHYFLTNQHPPSDFYIPLSNIVPRGIITEFLQNLYNKLHEGFVFTKTEQQYSFSSSILFHTFLDSVFHKQPAPVC